LASRSKQGLPPPGLLFEPASGGVAAMKTRSSRIRLPQAAPESSVEAEPPEAEVPAAIRLAPMMSIEEAATLLDVSETTIRRLINSGQLPAYRIGGQFRISEEDIRAYLATVRHGRP
jgi:excisionase family DNA binding protein